MTQESVQGREQGTSDLWYTFSYCTYNIYVCLWKHRGKAKYIARFIVFIPQVAGIKDFIFLKLYWNFQNFCNKHNLLPGKKKVLIILAKKGATTDYNLLSIIKKE